ncbi:VOC family protein [Lysinibacter sp. HNR]|uniref:VOC family protein n=1 Tax=Lysinibacter sp. HNR TaxID=3031408 RepID=UPI002435274C|nr:VOC family protein [Lysinibacter sp. HNR]WGD37153.1 VOC family protein [Lysinibacter sp. HNR]
MQNIFPTLWFNDNGEEAAKFYVSVFKNSRILETSYYGEGAPLPEGTALTVIFELDGVKFSALNGGPHVEFTEAVSFTVDAHTQQEIDHLWNALTADGGSPGQCGWLKDRYGVSWQIVPPILGTLLSQDNPERVARVMRVMLGQTKIVIRELQAASDG